MCHNSHKLVSCPRERDRAFGILWPRTKRKRERLVPCPQSFTGIFEMKHYFFYTDGYLIFSLTMPCTLHLSDHDINCFV